MIRAGIIGCGDVARRAYIPDIQELADRITVVAAFDTVADRAGDIVGMFPGATAYTSIEEFLDHEGGGAIDLVFNLTPAPLHWQITAQVLEARYHVYSEKPIASTVEEASELVRIAEHRGRELICAPATMVTGRFRWMKQFLDDGELGRTIAIKAHIGNMGPAAWGEYFGDPRVFYQQGVGPLIDTGVYMLHVMTGLLGPAKRIQAVGGIAIPERGTTIPRLQGEKIEVTTPDLFSINVDFGGETYGHLYSSFAIPQSKAPYFELYGEQGAISVDRVPWFHGNGPSDLFLLDRPLAGWRMVLPDPIRTNSILGSGILHAIQHLEDGEPLVMTAAHATHVLEIMNAAHESAQTGEAIDVETTL
ncbi:MAG TPA: Gfo/Idh/MocA family oxidoreductase [Thermomicrobiales bacterium]|nr:Gfo/Idh/MocA family oxidoreductase [Thermomicrobiales bacterium]